MPTVSGAQNNRLTFPGINGYPVYGSIYSISSVFLAPETPKWINPDTFFEINF